MQFVNMDVDRFGSHDRFQLGTFSPGLNAIYGPTGSGKSKLVRWLWAIFADSHLDDPNVAPGTDRPGGSVEIRIGQDQVRLQTRRSQHANEYGTFHHGDNHVRQPSDIQQRTLADLLAIPSDAKAIERLESLARKLDLERGAFRTRSSSRARTVARELEILDELKRLDGTGASRDALVARQRQLEAELHDLRRHRAPQISSDHPLQRQQLEEQIRVLDAEVQSATLHLEELDRSLARSQSDVEWSRVGDTNPETIERWETTYRERLAQLDGQLQRWRQTLRELRSFRDRLNQSATDARLDQQIGEHVSVVRQPDPRSALRTLESQIINMHRQLDELLGHYDRYRAETIGEAHVVLPDALRTMQKNLYEVCQQLSVHESLATKEALIEQSSQLQRCENELLSAIEKLIAQRGELLQSIADQYQVSREKIALAFGDTCQCEDHPRLNDWLLCQNHVDHRIGSNFDLELRPRQLAEIQRLEQDRLHANQRLGEARQRLRELRNQLLSLGEYHTAAVPQRHESEVLRELERVSRELRGVETRDRLRVELEEVRRSLDRGMPTTNLDSAFGDLVQRHVSAMNRSYLPRHREHQWSLDDRRVVGPYSRRGWASTDYSSSRRDYSGSTPYERHDFESPRMLHEVTSGYHTDAVPEPIVEIAIRLALAECLAQRGHSIPVVLDGTLDHLAPNRVDEVVRYLSRIADQRRQQINVITGSHAVESAVRDVRGQVLTLHPARRVAREFFDVNRQLSAYANDHQAEKWSVPETVEPMRVPMERRAERPHARFYLTEDSPVEQLASIDAANAAKMRTLGVDRIGELLGADPRWLAESLGHPAVFDSTVIAWQAEASLLCSVPQLRPFDARVLVGAGIRHPQQLAQMHPSRLLDRVEKFLATDRGREILRSGNSYELSRITTWIASAKSGAPQYRRSNFDDVAPLSQPAARAANHSDPESRHYRTATTAPNYSVVDREPTSPVDVHRMVPRSARDGRSRPERTASQRSKRGDRAGRRSERIAAPGTGHEMLDSAWRFYLDLTSPVVDAPSIGPRMAERLAHNGIQTVQQLLSANAENLASAIGSKSVSADTVRQWQEQARLVCRIPNLRGHDAQLLVHANINSPEELAATQAEVVLNQVHAVARTTEGQRILRGGKEPDLAEVTDWINWANHCRSIQAA